MHGSARNRAGSAGEASTIETEGLVRNEGWRYDLKGWFHDTFSEAGCGR